MKQQPETNTSISFEDFKQQMLNDFRTATISRACSLEGRKEVLTGKGKFGIFGDGKELPQLAMARSFRPGDFRSGYYRDQTLMMALGLYSPLDFFHGLYATTDIEKEPMSAGRQMGGHFVTQSVDEFGQWKNLMNQPNSSSDISPTAAQMPRLLGLAQASKVYRSLGLKGVDKFTDSGNEIAWGTIGNASTSEGLFFETINAAGVLQVPMVISVWDDEYGISVHAKHHTTKSSISAVLEGFRKTETQAGFEIFQVKGWDYPALIHAYENAAEWAREHHTPVLIHVIELTQPLGHSTSGSHERYKSTERLDWEKQYDCNRMFRQWMLDTAIATEEELQEIEQSVQKEVKEAKKAAWSDFVATHKAHQKSLIDVLQPLTKVSPNHVFIQGVINELGEIREPIKKDLISKARRTLRLVLGENHPEKEALVQWINDFMDLYQPKYSDHLYSETPQNATKIEAVAPQYATDAPLVDGRVVLRDNFEAMLQREEKLLIFGEDAGFIGDVNQGLEGLQERFGEIRVADTGIREATIIGQGIGLSLRGLRPIAEIQYLDYMLYAIQTLSDDLASLLYRTYGRQKAPLIIRTRGHRLEGIWHSGSPMGGLIHFLRGMYILSPRNMTVAAGMYNTLLASDEPAIVIESLNGYRLKELLPQNLGAFRVAIGRVEVLTEGADITVVSYGSTLRLVQEAVTALSAYGIEVELIDAQTLLPFDIDHQVLKSVQKTNRLLVVDEDVPGGCSAYLMQEIIEKQGAYAYLDSAPKTLTAKAHRPAYATDGDYFSKPNEEDIFESVYEMMHESNPDKFPKLR